MLYDTFLPFLAEPWLGVESGWPTFCCLLKVIRDWAILQWNSNDLMEGSISFLYTNKHYTKCRKLSQRKYYATTSLIYDLHHKLSPTYQLYQLLPYRNCNLSQLEGKRTLIESHPFASTVSLFSIVKIWNYVHRLVIHPFEIHNFLGWNSVVKITLIHYFVSFKVIW